MKQQTSLHIATPCHENWQAMTPTETGKFCAQCSQSVIDFTLMSDQQILNYLSSHAGRLCGRFDVDQLNRPLAEITVPKKKNWYAILSLPFLLFSQKSVAQPRERTVGKLAFKTEQKPASQGDAETTTPPHIPKWVIIQGTVQDEKGLPVSYASVIQKGTLTGASTDSAGRFSVRLPVTGKTVILEASYVGYAPVEKTISTAEADTTIAFSLTATEQPLGEVVVVGYTTQRRTDRLGGAVSICRKITRTEKADSTFRKITGTHPYSVYPNPAAPGSEVKVNIKKAGYYELQFLNNASVLIKTEMVRAEGSGTTISFQLRSGLAAGIYYLRLINTSDRTSFLEKIMVK